MDNTHNDYKSPTHLSSTSSLIPLQHSRNIVPSVAEAKQTGESNHHDQKFLHTSSRLSDVHALDHQHVSKSSRLLQYANSLSRLNSARDEGVDNDIPISEGPRSNRRITHSRRDLINQENMVRPGSNAGRSHLFMEYPSGRFFPQQNIVSNNIVHQSTIDNEHERREEVVKFFSLKSRSLLCFVQGILAGVGFQSFYESLKLTNIQSGTKDEAAISFQIYFFFTMISLVGYLTKIRLRNSSVNEDKKTADCFFISNLANSMFYSISLLLTCIILILEFLDAGVDTMIILGLILMRSCCCLLSWILSAWSQ